MNAIIVGLIGAVLSLGAIMGYAEYEQNLGALPLIQSAQLAASPSNGECLTTNGTVNDWASCSGVGGGLTTYDAFTHPIAGVSATTTPIRFTGGFFASSTVLIDNSTTTNATTTSLAILNLTAASCDVKASTAGILSCGTDANSGLSSYDAWTHPAAGQSATTSLMFFPGFISTASSTVGGNLNITGNATATNATTTNLYVTNPPVFSTLTSALLLTGTGGLLAEYAGSTCTNQAVTAISALGVATCTTLTTAYIADSYLLNNGDTGTGTYDFSGATVKQHTYSSFTYASTTAWAGTTTIPLGPAYTAESWSGVKCNTDTGTLFVQFSDGTNNMNGFQASTTVGTITLSSNNTFTASEKREVRIGTPASSPTKISCTVDKIVNN